MTVTTAPFQALPSILEVVGVQARRAAGRRPCRPRSAAKLSWKADVQLKLILHGRSPGPAACQSG